MSQPWFRRNERGIGPGLPIHRNGWILLGGFVAYLVVFPLLLEWLLGRPPGTPERFFAIVIVTAPVFLLAWRKTATETHHWPDE
jgi:hypothetical protein